MSAETPATDLLGAVRRKPNGRVIAVLRPSPPSPARWMVTDAWGSCGYETDEVVADWPVVGAVPYSPAAGFPMPAPASAAQCEAETAEPVGEQARCSDPIECGHEAALGQAEAERDQYRRALDAVRQDAAKWVRIESQIERAERKGYDLDAAHLLATAQGEAETAGGAL